VTAEIGPGTDAAPSRWRRLARRAGAVLQKLAPSLQAWRGAAWGLIVAGLAFWSVLAWDVLSLKERNPAALLPLLLLPLVGLIAGGLIVLLVSLLSRPPPFYRWALLSLPFLLLPPLLGTGKLGILAVFTAVVVSASLTGGGVSVLRARGEGGTRWKPRVALLVGVAMLAAGLAWLLRDGSAEKPLKNAAQTDPASRPASLDLPDPSQPGHVTVRTLTYGSGSDRHRPEYGQKAALKTPTVDGSPLIERWSGAAGWARTRYWGFDATKLPLQGRVWYPEGDGPFPLVLIVHGNHQAEDFSDPGYAYLGELLASRGYILVSVDENFLNSSVIDLLGLPHVGLKEENDARGWLLLEHLKVWRGWNAEAENPFHGKVDLQRIALIGHSRGGEAVAVAAAFNRLPFYPDDARVRFDYGFPIGAVVAIAPVDGQYKPAGVPTKVENVNYFVLHGSHDGDVQSFHGSRVYERVRFTDGADHFKAGLYIHRANHGQFNTSWGRGDSDSLGNAFLNRRALMPGEDQARIAKVYISAFLEASLRGAGGYRALFRDARVAGGWIPEGIYLNQYEDTATRYVCRYEEDIDVTTTTLPGGSAKGTNLADWKEKEIQIKWGSLDTRAVLLGWDNGRYLTPATYAITLPEAGLALDAASVLTFQLADAGKEPSKPLGAEQKKDEKEEKKDETKEPIDLTIEVADRTGQSARLPLSHVAALQPQIEVQVAKAGILNGEPTSEVVFQTFDFPIAAFKAENPSLDPVRLQTVRLVFDRTRKGVVVLDDVGFRPARTR